MVAYTQKEYFDMIMAYSAADQDPVSAAREYKRRHPDAGRFPLAPVFRNLVHRLQTHGNIMPMPNTGLLDRHVEFYAVELIRLVIDQFHADPNISTTIVAARLGLEHHDMIYRIAIDNGFCPYKYRKVQKLFDAQDYLSRRVYFETFLFNLRALPTLLKYILWTDECLFTPNGMWNSKNYVIWSDNDNPKAFKENKTQYKWSLMVWAGMIFGQIVS